MWDPSSLARDGTHTPALEAWSFNYWSTREVPTGRILKNTLFLSYFSQLYLVKPYNLLSSDTSAGKLEHYK